MSYDLDNDDLTPLQNRLHAARRALNEAYDRRDAIAQEAAVAEMNLGAAPRPQLLITLCVTERAVITAEADIKGVRVHLRRRQSPAFGRGDEGTGA